MSKKLTEKQKAFIDEYLVDLNATQAAIRAGYSPKRADVIGYENLRKPVIAKIISEKMAEREERTRITQDKVLEELGKIGFANLADYMTIGEDGDPVISFKNLTRDQAAALVEVTVEDFLHGRGEEAREVRRIKFKLGDKRAALVDIGKHLGMFARKVELTGKGGGPIKTEEEKPDLSKLSTKELRLYRDLVTKTTRVEDSESE